MQINFHIKGQKGSIRCGQGKNNLQWLADAALLWYQQTSKTQFHTTPIKVTTHSGQQLQLDKKIKDQLLNGDTVYVYMKDDVDFYNMGKSNT